MNCSKMLITYVFCIWFLLCFTLQVQATWVKLLSNAKYSGKSASSLETSLAFGKFDRVKAVYKSGFISAKGNFNGGSNCQYKWQCSNEERNGALKGAIDLYPECKGEAWAFELQSARSKSANDRQYILESDSWCSLPPECKIPTSKTGDIECDIQFEISNGMALAPTWYEASKRSNQNDNGGEIVVDIWGHSKLTQH